MFLRKSLFPYIGGKFHTIRWICENLDYSKKCYLELFGGSGVILFNKKPHEIEIFNDIDKELINFFLILKDKPNELKNELEKIPYSRQIYESYLMDYKNGEHFKKDDFERAVRWFYLIKSSFSGRLSYKAYGWGYSFVNSHSYTHFNSLNNFDFFSQRIKNVQIECRDFREVLNSIKKEKEKEICIYADPPFILENDAIDEYYFYHFRMKDHIDLAKKLNEMEASILISYYPCELVYELYPKEKWFFLEKEVVKHSQGITINSKTNKRDKLKELLIMNFKAQKGINDF